MRIIIAIIFTAAFAAYATTTTTALAQGTPTAGTPTAGTATAGTAAAPTATVDNEAAVTKAAADKAAADKAAADKAAADKAASAAVEGRDRDAGIQAFAVGASIAAEAHDAKCTLLAIVGAKGGFNRDLALRSVSDLAAGAVVNVANLYDESNFVVGIIGSEASIQLIEEGLLVDRVLVSGANIDDFTRAATKEGFVVSHESIACQASSRQEDQRRVAITVVEAIRKTKKKSTN